MKTIKTKAFMTMKMTQGIISNKQNTSCFWSPDWGRRCLDRSRTSSKRSCNSHHIMFLQASAILAPKNCLKAACRRQEKCSMHRSGVSYLRMSLATPHLLAPRAQLWSGTQFAALHRNSFGVHGTADHIPSLELRHIQWRQDFPS